MRYELNDNSNDNNVEARLTAYALGELEDIDRAEVELLLKGNPAARAEVESIRDIAGIVSRELQTEPAAVLSTAQRETIEARAGGSEPAVIFRFPHRRMWSYVGLTALAASIALIFLVPLWLDPEGTTRERNVAIGRSDDEVAAGEGLPHLEKSEQALGMLEAPREESQQGRDDFDRREIAGRAGQAMDEFLAEAPSDAASRRAERESRDETVRLREEFEGGAPGLETPAQSAGSPAPARPNEPAATPMPGGGGGGGGAGGGFGGGGSGPLGGAEATEGGVAGQRGLEIEAPPAPPLGDDADVAHLEETQFAAPTGFEDSTFSIDVDTASYSIIRRSILDGHLPLPGAVRIEEMLNYFTYNDAPPAADDPHPFASHIEIAACPWNPQHRLARISLKGRAIDMTNRVGSNIVFLIDVSGSMTNADKLPLVKESLKLLVNELTEDDRIGIVTYAGAAGVVLEPTAASPAKKMQIIDAIDALTAGGSTNGEAGVHTAYDLATKNFIDGGLNRVIMATDGDLNVGISDTDALRELIEEKRESGIYLSILGFGTGNVRDNKLEELSNHGNGNYAYIDGIDEGKRVLVEQIGGTLFTIAENVKIQIDFNPEEVGAYRLIGYENRRLAAQDFRDDQKDAGEIGAGHGVTALYEIIPPHLVDRHRLAMEERTREAQAPTPGFGGGGGGSGGAQPERETDATDRERDEARGQDPAQEAAAPSARDDNAESVPFEGNLLRLKLRYRVPGGEEVREFSSLAADPRESFESASADFQFAAAVATFGLVLRDSQFKGDASFSLAEELALPGADPQNDPTGYRAQFVELVRRAKEIASE